MGLRDYFFVKFDNIRYIPSKFLIIYLFFYNFFNFV
jgi:hypothetical protein